MLLIKFRKCEQISPDDWEMTTYEKLFSEDTKLSEVKKWIVKKGHKYYKPENTGNERIYSVGLSEPETDETK